jgi:hypothetical protein
VGEVAQSQDFNIVPDLPNLGGLWGSGPNDIYATGGNGAIIRYDGATWSGQKSSSAYSLRAIWGISASDVWTVGPLGSILRRQN